MFGKIKDIIKKRQEESQQREATSTGFKTVVDYNKWKQETRIKARERIVHTSQKKKKQKLKDKIEKNESNRNKSTLEVYADVFDKVGKGVDKFQKGVEKFEKGIDQLESGSNSRSKKKASYKRKTAPKRRQNTRRNTNRKSSNSGGDWGWLEGSSSNSKRNRRNGDGFSWLEN